MPTSINEIVADLKNKYGLTLSKLAGKKIFFTGEGKSGKSVVVAIPSSKVYERGNGWVDLTKTQLDIFKKHSVAIIVFRLSNAALYYVDMADLFPLLTQDAIHENTHEGKHWKLDIWPDKISPRKSIDSLPVQKNDQSSIRKYFT